MSRLATSFVLGYHGCDASVARKAVLDGDSIIYSNRDYDWLGPGAYFWESDPARALEWAQWKVTRGDYATPAVVGAVIDLGNCLDLVSREDIEVLSSAYVSFVALQEAASLPVPRNENPRGSTDSDRVLRFLDCAVFRHLHEQVEKAAETDTSIEPFHTVRGMFVEGGEAFPGSGLHKKSHVQIAVRDPACIKGLFLFRSA